MSARPLEDALLFGPLGAYERGLGLLASRAFDALRRPTAAPASLVEAARRELDGLPFHLAGARFDLYDVSVREALPPSVVEAWRMFSGLVAAAHRGEVRVFDVPVPGHDEVYVVYADEGGRGALEVYGACGAPLLSGTTREDALERWDEAFGAVRQSLR